MGLIIICQNVMDIKRLRMKYWLNRCEINNIYSEDSNEFQPIFSCEICAKRYLKKYIIPVPLNNNNGSDLLID